MYYVFQRCRDRSIIYTHKQDLVDFDPFGLDASLESMTTTAAASLIDPSSKYHAMRLLMLYTLAAVLVYKNGIQQYCVRDNHSPHGKLA